MALAQGWMPSLLRTRAALAHLRSTSAMGSSPDAPAAGTDLEAAIAASEAAGVPVLGALGSA